MQYDKLKKVFRLPPRLLANRKLKNFCFFWSSRKIEVESYTAFFVIKNVQNEGEAFFKLSLRCIQHCEKLRKKNIPFLIYNRFGKNMKLEKGSLVQGNPELDINQYIQYK